MVSFFKLFFFKGQSLTPTSAILCICRWSDRDSERLKPQQSRVLNSTTTGLEVSQKPLSSISPPRCQSDVERIPQSESEALGSSPAAVTNQCVMRGKTPAAVSLGLLNWEVQAPAPRPCWVQGHHDAETLCRLRST